MHRRNLGKHRASQDFCTRARASLCCWSPVNKGKGLTGGAPGYSTHGSPPGRSSCFARWFGGYAVRILSSRCLIYYCGTPCCWDRCSFGSASLFARRSFWSRRRWPSAGSNRNRLGLRSSGVLCHLFLSRSRLHFCCYGNSIPVSSSPSALPVLPLLPG